MLPIVENYIKWIGDNPRLATDLERGIRGVTLLANVYLRQKKHSLAVMEILTTACKLATYINDRFLERAVRCAHIARHSQLEHYLGFLETCEPALELGAAVAGGQFAKWAVVVAVQLVKAILRLMLLLKDRRMIASPAVEPIDREELAGDQSGNKSGRDGRQVSVGRVEIDEFVRMPRSGRKFRTMRAAPSLDMPRSWGVRAPSDANNNNNDFPNSIRARLHFPKLDAARLSAEAVYVAAPVAHLATMGICGGESWAPYVVSMSCDVFSFCAHHALSLRRSSLPLSPLERRELRNRRANLLLYLLRSPMYDNRTKAAVVASLGFCRDHIPLAGRVADMVLEYLPEYRDIYSYMWSK